MSTSTKRAIWAFVVAPIVPPLLFFLADPDHAGHSVATLLAILSFGALYAHPTVFILGVPAYWLINEYSRLGATHVLTLAGLVGAVVFSLMAKELTYKVVLGGAALGLSAGLTFWTIWRGSAAEPAVA